MKKKILIVSLIGVLLVVGLVLASCGGGCDNSHNCKWTGGIISNSGGGICTKTEKCVIFDSAKGTQAYESGQDVKCNC